MFKIISILKWRPLILKMDPASVVLFIFVGFAAGVIVTSLFFLLRKRKGEVMDNKDTKIKASDKMNGSFLPSPIIGEPFIELSMDNMVTPIDTVTFWKDDNLVDELHSSSALVEKYLESSMTTQSPTQGSYSPISQEDAPYFKSIEPSNKTIESSSTLRKETTLQQQSKPSLSINTDQRKNVQKENNVKDQESSKIQITRQKNASKDSVIRKKNSLSSERRSSKTSPISRKTTERKSIISSQPVAIEAELSENDEDDMPLGLKQFTVSK